MNEQTPQTLQSRVITRALQDESFKRQLLIGSNAAKAAIEQEIGQELPQDLQINVLEETANVSHIVLPIMSSNEEISEKELESVAGGFLIPCTFGSITIG
ncbi:MAG: NHLP leader peptide family natural product precursor [Richelia sp. RM2_1_2]|nr:NHLP leader peptide family natural product precursor [Richelia sp. SM1_7_0]NJN10444.1 NHLP leader peptide family natural product precursor [Richelia sp. RM1_1_1]NJO62792.1 NHLP leader peptide family natural product precursor [Richelia sp. RM2_1_2]